VAVSDFFFQLFVMREACLVSAAGSACVLTQRPGCVRVNVWRYSNKLRIREDRRASQLILGTSSYEDSQVKWVCWARNVSTSG